VEGRNIKIILVYEIMYKNIYLQNDHHRKAVAVNLTPFEFTNNFAEGASMRYIGVSAT
jgi:hypothetical protein